ncbi:rhomboid family intramembrane serine protease [Desulfatibacillum aliphaticivorans]|uniref:rhomboid family intramembrane serine protease n=1 Tax=Desulfatibacillum aliphaticivorans TaxID=218208 RepID=UPI0004239A78|nr:rhomboid family intramembrane serine protease [Desulfatibacillum aliphaticivorans]
MTPLFIKNLPDNKANLYGLILEASKIAYEFERKEDGWQILVPQKDHDRAFAQITAYTGENLPQDLDEPKWPQFKTYSGLWAAGLLAVFYAGTGPFSENRWLLEQKGAVAEKILDGQIWRAVTALCLHADMLHLMGNMAFLAIFATGVCQVMGYGVGWLFILLAGALGNLASAWMYQSHHLSGGASTAVFAALGILGGIRAIRQKAGWGLTSRRWIGLAVGLALLAFLGSGPKADLLAHFFGWFCGVGMGVVYALLKPTPVPQKKQLPFLTLALAILLWAWASAGF